MPIENIEGIWLEFECSALLTWIIQQKNWREKKSAKIPKSRSPEYLLKAMIDAEGEDIEVNSDKCQFTQFQINADIHLQFEINDDPEKFL